MEALNRAEVSRDANVDLLDAELAVLAAQADVARRDDVDTHAEAVTTDRADDGNATLFEAACLPLQHADPITNDDGLAGCIALITGRGVVASVADLGRACEVYTSSEVLAG